MKRVRQLTRANSTLNLNQQLGVRGRPRLKRNNNIVSGRPNSRARSVSRNRAGLTRANSTQNLRERSASRQRKAAPLRLKRSNIQTNSNGQTAQRGRSRSLRRQQQQQQQQLPRSRSNTRRAPSVNARLQPKRQNINQTKRKQPSTTISNIRRGRITKNTGQQGQQRRGQFVPRFFFSLQIINVSASQTVYDKYIQTFQRSTG